MGRVRAINPAVCPVCSSKNTKRGGVVQGRGVSVWKCFEPECGHTFYIPVIVLVKEAS